MKYIYFITLALFFTIQGKSQEKKNLKPDSKLFEYISQFDNHNEFIINDDTDLTFKYSEKYLGASDGNFNLTLSRHIQIKINKVDLIQDKKLFIYTNNDSITNIRFKKIKVYNKKGNKIKIKKSQPTPNLISQDQDKITIDLKKLQISDNSILEIKYTVSELQKKAQIFKFKYQYFTINSNLNISIPEIYKYEIAENDTNNIIFEHKVNEQKGSFIGYYMPDTNLQNKLVTKTYYKIVKERGENVSNAKSIYCKHINHHYTIKKNSVNNSSIELKLINIKPIISML